MPGNWNTASGRKGPFHFYVDFGRAGTNEWEPLNEAPLVDVCTWFDPAQRHWDHLADFYYRIRLVLPNEKPDANGDCPHYNSAPQQANGLWSKRDWLVAREIARKEYLQQRKGPNKTAVGYLLKRRRFGEPCPQCLDYNTREVASSSCPNCLGTGITLGYYPAIDYTLTFMNTPDREFKRDPQVALRNDIVREGRAVAYPFLDTNDVYFRRDSGERFYINKINNAAEVGGIPIVVLVELRLAPVTDIIYTIPLTPAALSSSSSSALATGPACDWRVGLKDLENW